MMNGTYTDLNEYIFDAAASRVAGNVVGFSKKAVPLLATTALSVVLFLTGCAGTAGVTVPCNCTIPPTSPTAPDCPTVVKNLVSQYANSGDTAPSAADALTFGQTCGGATTPFPGNYQNYTGSTATGVILYGANGGPITGIGDISIYPTIWTDNAGNRISTGAKDAIILTPNGNVISGNLVQSGETFDNNKNQYGYLQIPGIPVSPSYATASTLFKKAGVGVANQTWPTPVTGGALTATQSSSLDFGRGLSQWNSGNVASILNDATNIAGLGTPNDPGMQGMTQAAANALPYSQFQYAMYEDLSTALTGTTKVNGVTQTGPINGTGVGCVLKVDTRGKTTTCFNRTPYVTAIALDRTTPNGDVSVPNTDSSYQQAVAYANYFKVPTITVSGQPVTLIATGGIASMAVSKDEMTVDVAYNNGLKGTLLGPAFQPLSETNRQLNLKSATEDLGPVSETVTTPLPEEIKLETPKPSQEQIQSTIDDMNKEFGPSNAPIKIDTPAAAPAAPVEAPPPAEAPPAPQAMVNTRAKNAFASQLLALFAPPAANDPQQYANAAYGMARLG